MRLVTMDVRPLVGWLVATGLCVLGGVVPSTAAPPKNVLILSEGPVTSLATVPVHGTSRNFLGRGIVGGVMFDLVSHGTDLAQHARQILSGVPAADLVPMRTPTLTAFDWHELKRFGIDEALLLAGATVVNRELSRWAVYQRTILVIGAVLVGQSLLIGGLLIQRHRRRRAELALRDRQEELTRSQSRYTLATAAGAVGLWDWNLETNEIYVDPTLKSILGFEDAEITKRADDWGSRVHPEDLAAVTAQAQACISGILSEYEVEHRMTHKDGSVRWFLSRGSLLRRADGTPHRLVGTKVEITERKRAEEAIRENEAVLRASNQEIQNLAGRLIAAQEVERARIARDLHDDVSQQLAAMAIALSALKRRAAAVPGGMDLQNDVESLQQRTSALAKSVRDLSHDLHPDVLKHAGLAASLTAYCDGLSLSEGLALTCSAQGELESIDSEAALCLYRIAQEALHNVVKHAQARQAEVRLLRTGDSAELAIADDGKGFDVQTRKTRGLGLMSITERVRLAGGTLSIVTALNEGTQIRVQVPIKTRKTTDSVDLSEQFASQA